MFKKNKKLQTERRRPPLKRPYGSAPVFSYHASRSARISNTGRDQGATDEVEAAKVRPVDRRAIWRRTKLTVGATCGAALLLGLTVVVPQPQVQVVGSESERLFLRDQVQYQQAAQQVVRSSLLNRSKLTFDASGAEEKLRQQFPELASVSVTLPLFGWQPSVYVQAFTPSMVLIRPGASIDFVLDQAGRAYVPESIQSLLKKADLPVVTDESGLDIRALQVALPADHVAFIVEVYAQLLTAELEVVGMSLPSAQSELRVRIKDAPYTVRFNLYGSAREGAGRYLAARAYMQSNNQAPRQYVDVRVDGRVFYK